MKMWNGDLRLWEVSCTSNVGGSTFLVMADSLKTVKYLCKAREEVPALKQLQFQELLLTPTVIYPYIKNCDLPDLVHDLAYETKEATG